MPPSCRNLRPIFLDPPHVNVFHSLAARSLLVARRSALVRALDIVCSALSPIIVFVNVVRRARLLGTLPPPLLS